MTVTSHPGDFVYRSFGSQEPCGVYMVAEPDQLVVVEIDYSDVPCSEEGLVVVSIREKRLTTNVTFYNVISKLIISLSHLGILQ